MLKEAIEKIVSLATPQTYVIDGENYALEELVRIAPHIDRPSKFLFASLDGVVKAIQAEIDRVDCPVFVSVTAPGIVDVFTTYRHDNMERDNLYTAFVQLPDSSKEWMGHEEAMIALRSRFVETEDTKYILDLLSSISDENSVKSTDNGLTQTVNVKQGIALQTTAKIKPRVTLKPFRTFLEVDQPESEFLLRMRSGDPNRGTEAEIGLFEADGGAWKLQAKKNIAAYFDDKLSSLIKNGKVIVAE